MRRIKKDITIRYVPNLLLDEGRTLQSFSYDRTWTIHRYLEKSGVIFKDMRIIVNGEEIKDLEQLLNIGDEIVIVPSIEEPITTWWAAATFWQGVALVISAAALVYSVVSFFIKPKKPSFGTTGVGMDEDSPSASWTGVRTMREPGGSVPIIYGRRLTGGTVINEYITTNGDKNYLHSLVAIGEGKLHSITLSRINRNLAANFTGYSVTTRLGTNDQTVIPNFEDLHHLFPLNIELTKDNANVYTTDASDVEAFEIRLTLPGVYQADSSGNILAWAVTYKVEYKLHAAGEYTDLGSTTINAKSRSEVRRIYRKEGLTAGQYDIRITRTSDNSSLDPIKEGDLYLSGVDEINTDDLEYPNTGLAGLKTLAIEQLSGDNPNYEFSVEGREISVPKVMLGEAEVDWEDYYWDPEAELYKLISDDTELSWDGETYVDKFSANPIWCIYDLMIKTRYGMGDYITAADNELDYLLEKSRYCEEKVADGENGWEKRFRMDVCIDSPQQALDLIMQLATIFRGLPFYSDNGKIRIAIDKPDTSVQLFGMGNIVEESFSQAWNSKRDIPNIVYVQYDNEDNYYQQEKISVVDEAALAAGKPINKKDTRYYGTKLSYAIRHGRNFIKTAKYIDQTISIKGGSGALVRQCGEVIDIAHDVPLYGFSGRLKTGSTTTKVRLDREVIIEVTKSYRVRVDFAEPNVDGSARYEERTVTNSPGTHWDLDVSAVFSKAPEEFDVYSFGEVDKVVFPVRIMALRRLRMGEVEMETVEYNADIYDDSAVTIPTKKISALSMEVPYVENLNLTEGIVRSKDGTIQNVIDVWFRKPSLISYILRRLLKCKIYLSDDNGASWEYVGETYGDSFSIVKVLTAEMEYKVVVVSVSNDNAENLISSSPQAIIQLAGKSAPPSDITSFLVNQSRDRIYFGWTEIPDGDLWYYEIKLGSDWDSGLVLVAGLKSDHYITTDLRAGTGQKYWIKAIDTSGNYSESAKQATITIDNIPFKNIIEEYSEQTAWAGTKDNTEVDGDNLIISSGELSGTYITPVRDLGYVATFAVIVESVTSISQSLKFNDDAAKKFNDDPTLRFTGTETPGAATFEIKTSEDNVEWTEYAAYQVGDYKCRYFQIKMTLTRASLGDALNCSKLDYYADLPDIDEVQDGEIEVAADGDDITFGKDFHENPNVAVVILTGDGVYWKATGLDTTDVNIKAYDENGVIKTGTFRIHIHGV